MASLHTISNCINNPHRKYRKFCVKQQQEETTVGNTTVFHGRYSLFHTVGSIRWHSPHVFSSCVTRMSRYVANDN